MVLLQHQVQGDRNNNSGSNNNSSTNPTDQPPIFGGFDLGEGDTESPAFGGFGLGDEP
jgi:hypothetical protein